MLFGGRGQAAQAQTRAGKGAGVARRGAIVMAVDDDATSRAAITEALEEVGYQVRAVPNYQAWDDAWRQGPPPDLLLLDINLTEPRRGGYEILRALRREDTRTPVVMVSSRNTPTDAAFAKANNANGFVSKVQGEFDHPERGLVATVNRLLAS